MPPSRTPERYLKATVRAAKVGTLRYTDRNGRSWLEDVPESTLFDRRSMDSLKHVPIVIPHHGTIDASNYTKHAVGIALDNPRRDGKYLLIDVSVRDEKSIERILSGEYEQVSLGYFAKREMIGGLITQIFRWYNHLAFVIKGRAGDAVKLLRNDSQDEITLDELDVETITVEFIEDSIQVIESVEPEEKKMSTELFTLTIAGLEGKRVATEDASAIQSYVRAQSQLVEDGEARVAELETTVADMESRQDGMKEDMAKMKKDMAAMEAAKKKAEEEKADMMKKMDKMKSDMSEETKKKMARYDSIRAVVTDASLKDFLEDEAPFVSKFIKSRIPAVTDEMIQDSAQVETLFTLAQNIKVESKVTQDSSASLEALVNSSINNKPASDGKKVTQDWLQDKYQSNFIINKSN